jgi:hypothetical protein
VGSRRVLERDAVAQTAAATVRAILGSGLGSGGTVEEFEVGHARVSERADEDIAIHIRGAILFLLTVTCFCSPSFFQPVHSGTMALSRTSSPSDHPPRERLAGEHAVRHVRRMRGFQAKCTIGSVS